MVLLSRLLWVNTLPHENFSLDCGKTVAVIGTTWSYLKNEILFEAYIKQPEMACFSDLTFSMPMFYAVKS